MTEINFNCSQDLTIFSVTFYGKSVIIKLTDSEAKCQLL